MFKFQELKEWYARFKGRKFYNRVRKVYTRSKDIKQNNEIIEIRDIYSVEELKNINIDLFHINIEGGEYELIRRMIETNMIIHINSLQVQFHEWYPSQKESRVLRNQIHDELNKTHKLDYSYDFVWEKWSKKV